EIGNSAAGGWDCRRSGHRSAAAMAARRPPATALDRSRKERWRGERSRRPLGYPAAAPQHSLAEPRIAGAEKSVPENPCANPTTQTMIITNRGIVSLFAGSAIPHDSCG